jgi:two-component system sensor histidine kinase PilS (NtrC family)
MVNDMQDGVMLVRANGVVVAANPAALVLLGVQQNERIREGQVRVGERENVLFDLRRMPRLQPLLEMLRDWIRMKDDVPRILQLLPLPSRPSSSARNSMHTRLRLRFVLPGLAGLRSTLAGALTSPSGLDTTSWNDMSPEGAARLRLAIAQNEAMAWSPADEALLRSEMRDTVLVHIESWERIAEQVQQENSPRWAGWSPASRTRSATRSRRSARPTNCWPTPAVARATSMPAAAHHQRQRATARSGDFRCAAAVAPPAYRA